MNDCTPPAADQLDVSIGNPYGMRQRGTRSKKTQAIEHGRGAATIAPVSFDSLDLRFHKMRVKRQGMCLGQITARGEEFIAAAFRNNGSDGYSDEALPGPVRQSVTACSTMRNNSWPSRSGKSSSRARSKDGSRRSVNPGIVR